MNRHERIDNLRMQIADVIIDLNLCEKEIKEIISDYLSAKDTYFVQEVLLNNHVMNLSSKVKVLFYIIAAEKIEVDKQFKTALNIIMNKRNVLAHSDTVLDDFTLDTVEFDYSRDGTTAYPVYKDADPVTLTFNSNGDINYENVEKIIADFDKYYKIVSDQLQKIAMTIRLKHRT